MNRKDKALLAMSGFLGGTSFSIFAFRPNHKDILKESHYIWLVFFLGSLVFCLRDILRRTAGQTMRSR